MTTVPHTLEVRPDSWDRSLFINRELSWLAFNDRVLAEAFDGSLPLFDRLKFLSIAAGNLDEFFMVRVAGLQQQLQSGVAETSADGMTPSEQLATIREHASAMVSSMYQVWEQIRTSLAEVGLRVLNHRDLTHEQKVAAKQYFLTSVLPALTPLAVDPGHPFPHLKNKSINLAVLLRREGKGKGRRRRQDFVDHAFAVVQVPSVLARWVKIPASNGQAIVALEELITAHVSDLFPGFSAVQTTAFRATRNWDLDLDEEESEDLLSTIQEELRRRERGAAVRLELNADAHPSLENHLRQALKLSPADVYRLQGPLQYSDVAALSEFDARPELRADPWVSVVPPALKDTDSLLSILSQRDVLLHHPYESFDPIVRFIEEAAEDSNVLAIKLTLYRTGGDNPIGRALMRAAENGKQVAVLVEIKARLDEANNIAWARRMEENGVHVVYGLIGLKTHCKVALVVRREGFGIKRYVHVGTGNYNPNTARLYTDISLLTSRPEIADDVGALFNLLTGYSDAPQWKRLAVAPMGLHRRILELITAETKKARAGELARIQAKMNSLVDPQVIRALYEASQAGVEIDLLVRGVCCLRPGIPGISERIRVHSIVDRFLEHSRVFAFGSGSHVEVFISSADWMPRNFHRRVEVLCPVEEPSLKLRLLEEVLQLGFKDNVKARRLRVDGTYESVVEQDGVIRSQAILMEAVRKPLESRLSSPLIRHLASPKAHNKNEPSHGPT